MKRLAFFASGGGTNFQAVIDEVKAGEINATIEALIVSNNKAYARERALNNGIRAFLFNKNLYQNVEEMFEEILKLVNILEIDYIILAGYLTVLAQNFVKNFKGKIINIHPSLIPKYCGKGFYGMRVHEAVLAAKETESGLTVHFADEGVDTGEIITQVRVPVMENDTPQTLQTRILSHENKTLADVIKKLCK